MEWKAEGRTDKMARKGAVEMGWWEVPWHALGINTAAFLALSQPDFCISASTDR